MNKGFTLMELLVVVIVMAVLSAISIPVVLSQIEKARYTEVTVRLKTLRDELERYRLEHGQYPPDKLPNQKPMNIDGPWEEGLPWGSQLDYDHWKVGDRCYVQLAYWGKSKRRAYPLNSIVVEPPGIERVDDNLVIGIAIYQCNRRPPRKFD